MINVGMGVIFEAQEKYKGVEIKLLRQSLPKCCPSIPKDLVKIEVTSVEIEALTAVQVALLTIYDMCNVAYWPFSACQNLENTVL